MKTLEGSKDAFGKRGRFLDIREANVIKKSETKIKRKKGGNSTYRG